MRRTLIILLTAMAIFISAPAFGTNGVLSLDGNGDYVEMADSEALNDIGSQVTMEAWIKATAFPGQWIPIICKVDKIFDGKNRSYLLTLNGPNSSVHISSCSQSGRRDLQTSHGLIMLNTWFHFAGVIDARNSVMRIFVNGIELAQGPTAGEDIHVSSPPLWIGAQHEEGARSQFAGQIDEVRIWNIARTQEQIRGTMYTSLSGKEPGLVGYWRFDDVGDTVTDSSPSGAHGKLMGDAHFVESKLPTPGELAILTVLSGVVTDETGQPIPNASVCLEQRGKRIAQAQWTSASGSYRIAILNPVRGLYDLSATAGERGGWQLGIRLRAGESQIQNLILKEAISIQGTLLMLDDTTPHVHVMVQAIRGRELIAAARSDAGGKYQFINLKPGEYRVRCQVIDGHIYYRDTDDALTVTAYQDKVEDTGDILTVGPGKPYEDVDFHFAPFKKGTWRNYGYLDGLADEWVTAVCSAPDGTLWFGTNGGASRYDGEKFTNFTKEEDGLVHNAVLACYAHTDGTMWFGTRGGISCYDGRKFTNFAAEDGLASNEGGVSCVSSICRDSQGAIWFGTGWSDTSGGGVSRYDGSEFVTFTSEDGLVSNAVTSISRSPDGTLWFGTWGGGVCCYDGEGFVRLSGLSSGNVFTVYCTPDGVVWIGSLRGVSRYDGKELVSFDTNDGLSGNYVYAIHSTPDGAMWFGTESGVSRYDGVGFVNFSTTDGLVSNDVEAIHHTPDGAVWFGTGKGISRYSSRTLSSLTTRDGLVDDRINDIYCAPDGVIWFATAGGVSHYNGSEFVTLPVKADVSTICRDSDGAMWFTSWFGGNYRYDEEGLAKPTFVLQWGEGNLGVYPASDGSLWFTHWGWGAGRYDGEKLEQFRKVEGLAGNIVNDISQDTDGNLWFGTRNGGVSRYDGEKFVNFTVEDGLIDNQVSTVHCAHDGIVWFGTVRGVSRYDSSNIGNSPHFVNYTIEDGLVYNFVNAIQSTSDGAVWFGTNGGGACRYDGTTWTSLDARDGLSNYITSVLEDEDGTLWFGTGDSGVISYRPDATPPQVRIASAKVRKQLYTDLAAIPAVTVGDDVTIEYSAIDFKTVPGKRQYRSRIYGAQSKKEISSEWGKPTRESEFEWTPEKPGVYAFEVQAIDRDLNYSEPRSIELTVVSPFYLRAIFLVPTIGFGMLLVATMVFLATALTKRRRQVHAYQLAAVAELRDAREMQMSLLPEAAPQVEGMEIAGKSITANTVGGDFFDYLTMPNGNVGIAVADVSGKGLRAAMNAVLAAGILHDAAPMESSCGSILSRLNSHLCPLMERRMFTALSFAILDHSAGVIQWSNAAQPLPLIKRNNTVSEAEVDGELPLGMVPDVRYPDYELELQPGDLVIFYTDGIIEAENDAEEMYGTERLLDLVAGIDSAANAEDVIEAILQDVSGFAGSAQQYDDMTIVVLKKV